MAVNFPDSPSVNDTFTSGTRTYKYDGTSWRLFSSTVALPSADLIPPGNEEQDLGSPTNRYKDLYLSANSIHLGNTVLTEESLGDLGGGATTVYATASLLPRTGIDAGATAFVTETSRFYIWNGVGWFNVAVVNNTPTITNAPSATYNLFANGSPTIITLAATDVDGDTLTWSYNAPEADGKATITQADNVFTITPLTDIADTSFTIDFEVTDGINISTASSTVNIDNRAPSISTAPAATYALATDGSPTVITLAATDPDGGSITWSYAATGLSGQATVVQNVNEFTITPATTPQEYADFTITFTASDSIESTSTSPTTLSLTFVLVADAWSDTVLSIGTSSTNSLGNSTFIDRSTNASTVTTFGTPIQTAFHPYLDNWSVYFDGEGDYLTADMSNVSIGETNFTIEMWIWPDEIRQCTLLDVRPSPTATPFNVGLNSSGQLAMYAVTSYTFNYSANNTIIPGKWNHICFERRGNELKGYLNGSWKESFSSSVSMGSGASSAFIGANLGSGGGSNFFKGYISNLHIRASGSTSPFDYKYGDNFTPDINRTSTMSGTVFLGLQDNRHLDNSSNSATVARGGSGTPMIKSFSASGQESEYAIGENKGSAYFDGTGYLSVTNSIDFSPGDGDFCYEGWFKFDNDNVDVGLFCGTNLSIGMFDIRRISDGSLRIGRYSTAWDSYTSGVTLSDAWHHIAFVRNSGTVAIYVDGVNRIQTGASNSINYSFGSSNLAIGDNSTVNEFSGYMSDIRITKGSPVYTSAFTPPTAPVGNTNASLYLPMDNVGIFDKTGNNTLTLGTGTKTTTTQTKYSDTSIDFNNNDYRVYAPGIEFPGDFTMEGWVWWPFNAGNRLIATNRSSVSATGAGQWWIDEYNGNRRFYFDTGARIDVPGQFSTDQWSHWAVCRSGSTVRVFINGINVGSATTTNNLGSSNTIKIGGFGDTNSYAFAGYQEGFQILTGVAKYTTNFTPPTQEQGRAYQAES